MKRHRCFEWCKGFCFYVEGFLIFCDFVDVVIWSRVAKCHILPGNSNRYNFFSLIHILSTLNLKS